MQFIKTHSNDLWSFRLEKERFSYYLDLIGSVIKDIKAYSMTLSSSGCAHLFLLDAENLLSHHHWDGFSWHKSQAWRGVLPFFRAVSDKQNNIYLLFATPEGGHFAIFKEGRWQSNALPFFTDNFTPLELYFLPNNKLFLIYQKTLGQQLELFYRFFSLESKDWGRELPLATLPKDHHHLKLWFYANKLYLTYVLPQLSSNLIFIIFYEETKILFQQQLSNVSFVKNLPPLLTLLESDLMILIVQEKNKLVCWFSPDQGLTWKTKKEIHCPFTLQLAPVQNCQGELTSFVAMTGFEGIKFTKPAIIESRELLNLNPGSL